MNKSQEFPKKFTDPKTGELNVGALLQSYEALERKLSRGEASSPAEEARAPGLPDTPEQYRIEILEEYLERDPEMEAVLHRAGFTEEQVQLVYDLAAEKLAPLIAEMARGARDATDSARLESHFGGKDRWQEIRRQMRKWGERNLPRDAYRALCASYDGVMAMHRMMSHGNEPDLVRGGDGGEALTEEQLRRIMNDPRYWRDRDPAVTRKVRQGFEQLYPGST